MSSTTKSASTFKVGGDIEINRVGYGGMQLTGKGVWGDAPDRDTAKKVLQAAVAAGVNFIDTADSYGPHTNEVLIADALYPYPKNLLIATKGGFERTGPNKWIVNGDPKHIKEAIEGSLKRLKLDVIDLWQLHRFDSKFPIAETLGPVVDAVQAGKIRYVGLSEVDVKQIESAEKVIPIVSVQNLYNLGNRQWENVLDYTVQRGMAFIPWYPLASGPDKLKSKITSIAEKHQATTAQIALAWLAKRASNILLIPGTSSLEHLNENLAAANIELSDEDFAALSQ
ncbi:aldo/keto reductase [Dyadobacter pollutisoli]|uniref:Aldo/keto reductase n=1 Tax=Dyadobacter pollutisoli TaxID=2910158 RepID=A0A9E8NGN0_9BACT|nr:aldo/keto reductase [Dyadobacter pollutisoli]WAC13719.1 aldo/keto reductase [Dyadobacter pollutisoli]